MASHSGPVVCLHNYTCTCIQLHDSVLMQVYDVSFMNPSQRFVSISQSFCATYTVHVHVAVMGRKQTLFHHII